jgi:hypothetical protein
MTSWLPSRIEARPPALLACEDGARALAAIGVVAGLDQLRPSADPLVVVIDESRRLQDAAEPLDAAVDVADGDDARGCLRGKGAAQQDGGGDRGEGAHVSV